jgi:hypothetical protein
MPYQQQSNSMNNIQQQPVNNLLRVTGPESAKAYSLPPNSNVVLFDADNPIFYLKSTDDSGFANLRTFTFEEQKPVEIQPQPITEQIDTSNFVTKDDLKALKNDFSELKEMLEGLVN